MSEIEANTEMSIYNGMTRKQFVKNVVVLGAATQIPWLVGCTEEDAEQRLDRSKLTRDQLVLELLFPADEHGPGAVDMFVDKYIAWITKDPLLDANENKFVLEGFDKVDDFAIEAKGEDFVSLTEEEQDAILSEIAKDQNWGRTWCSRILTIIFEATLCHPLYGSNPDEKGWNWLNHKAGSPPPTKELMYPEIFKTINGK